MTAQKGAQGTEPYLPFYHLQNNSIDIVQHTEIVTIMTDSLP